MPEKTALDSATDSRRDSIGHGLHTLRLQRLTASWGAIAWLAAFLSAAGAAESIRPAGPIGGTDIQQALLPPPGVYAAAVVAPVDLFSFSTERGSTPASGFSIDAGAAILVVYRTTVFGGTIASSISASYGHTCFQLQAQTNHCSYGGLNDSYVDAFVWSRFYASADFESTSNIAPQIPYGLAMQVGLGIAFPTGRYDTGRILNNGSNFLDIAPNIALTYNFRSVFGHWLGQATEVSVRLWLNNYTEDHSTHYQTGRLVNGDFALTQRLDRWQFGIAGTAFRQIQDDSLSGFGVPNGGHRASGVALGPLVSYTFTTERRVWNVILKGLYAVSASNAASPRGIVLRVVTRF